MPSCINHIIGNWCEHREPLFGQPCMGVPTHLVQAMTNRSIMQQKPWCRWAGLLQLLAAKCSGACMVNFPPSWAVLWRLLRYLRDPFAFGFLFARQWKGSSVKFSSRTSPFTSFCPNCFWYFWKSLYRHFLSVHRNSHWRTAWFRTSLKWCFCCWAGRKRHFRYRSLGARTCVLLDHGFWVHGLFPY